MTCNVLHNIAVKLRLPMPDEDEHPADDDNDGNDGNNEGVPTLTGRATRDRLVQRYFSGYTHFPNHIILLTYFILIITVNLLKCRPLRLALKQ